MRRETKKGGQEGRQGEENRGGERRGRQRGIFLTESKNKHKKGVKNRRNIKKEGEELNKQQTAALCCCVLAPLVPLCCLAELR